MPDSTAHHHLEADLRQGPLHLRVAFDLTAPWTVLFGASGSGKSTVLRSIAGLFPKSAINFASAAPDGWIELQGKHHWTPPHARHLAYAPQGSNLFPHVTIRKNISFATDSTQQPSPQLIHEALLLFELSALADRMPSDLSGGERQRVNLARAFAVPHPRLFLLDEPFTGVDRATRDRLIPAMQQRAAHLGIPVLSVTHDVEEALLLGAEVIRLDHGTVTAQGPAFTVLAAERARMLSILQL